MERRALIALLASGLAGCSSQTPQDGTGMIRDRDFTETGECENPETATVAFESSQVRVTGCITGANGCSTAELGEATLDGDELRVVVRTDDSIPPGKACTQALIYIGYETTVTFDGELPQTVSVVHESTSSDGVVAEATRP